MVSPVIREISGLKELGQAIAKLDAKVRDRLGPRATGRAANVIKRRAKLRIEHNESKNGSAVDTGSLRDALIVKKVPKTQTQLTSEHIVTVRGRGKPKVNKKGVKQAQAPHAHLVEFGTINQPPEPFLRPAIDEGHTEAADVMIGVLREAAEP